MFVWGLSHKIVFISPAITGRYVNNELKNKGKEEGEIKYKCGVLNGNNVPEVKEIHEKWEKRVGIPRETDSDTAGWLTRKEEYEGRPGSRVVQRKKSY